MDRIVAGLILLFLAVVIPSNAQSTNEPAATTPAVTAKPDSLPSITPVASEYPRVYYDVLRNLSLRCDFAKEAGQSYFWTKNGTNIEQLKERFELDDGGRVLKTVGRPQEDDHGNFTCSMGNNVQGWEVRGRPHLKLPQNTNVVEQQKVKMQCKITGKPYPQQVQWFYRNDTEPSHDKRDYTEVMASETVKMEPNEQGVPNGALVIEGSKRSDAGQYMCLVEEESLSANSTTTLRVKDMYAALWPFLGICVEVFVLCAIILVYEKRRTKPELDDSDTDNHDQKKS